MGQKHFVAVGQMTSTPDPHHNARMACSIIRRAAKCSAKLVTLPEACDFIAGPDEVLKLATSLEESDFLNAIRKEAKESKVWVIVGMHERCKDEERVYNSCVLVSDSGSIASKYEKVHLLDVDVQGGDSVQESSLTKPGERLTEPSETPLGKIGLLVCYDLRFPAAAQNLRRRGAQVISMSSAFTARTGGVHWEPLLRARAIENQAYVLAANQIGTHPSGRQSFGHAMIVDPWGCVVARCSDRPPADATKQGDDEGQFCMSEIDIDWVEELRKSMPLVEQMRDDLYALP
ncbi:hypothetical protein JCM10212_006950 [Sporobolomyces blumeae]